MKHRAARPALSNPLVIVSLLAALLLGGCAGDLAREESQLLATVAGESLRQADALAAQGKISEAAEAYLEIARGASSPAREQLQLKAVRAHLAAGDTASAQQVSGQIERPRLTIGQREQLHLSEAELALLDGRPSDAIRRLQSMQTPILPKTMKVQRLATLAAAQRLANAPSDAARSLAQLDRLLDDDESRLLNQVSILSTLSQVSPATLRELRNGGDTLAGWAEIALITREVSDDPAELQRRFLQTRGQRIGQMHPRLAHAYAAMLTGGYGSDDTLTVMLPSSGRFSAAATAVREGIEAARTADTSGQPPRLVFIDSSNAARVLAGHARAVAEGADYVVGPLEKESVDRLAAGPALAVPTLALNRTTRDSPPAENLFQFALSPENEAAEAATKASAMGLKRALILYPEGAWGERLASAFRDRWQRLGGILNGQSTYNPTARRQDKTIDMLVGDTAAQVLFLVATPELAYQTYPRIRLSAPSLTVISTSHVYSGVFDPARDAVLAGLWFVDVPWMIDQSGSGSLSRRQLSGASFTVANPLARLYAMGIDAYRITPRLTGLARHPGAFYPGQTGGLSLDTLGRVQRQLALARFTESAVQEVAEITTQTATTPPPP